MSTLLRFDPLAVFVGSFVALFFLLAAIYSIAYFGKRDGRARFLFLSLVTLLVSEGAVFADNLLLLLALWGFLGVLLYLLIDPGRNEEASRTAKKTLVIVGGTDAIMLLGFGLAWMLVPDTDPTQLLISRLRLDLGDTTALVSFICLAAGALAKAGGMPFHTWVPDTAEDAPIPVTAFLPASLDKLLGIYLLTRLMMEVFGSTSVIAPWVMTLGAATILLAVMMALVQHDMRRLLGYHAVSQVGYMILGLGTGTPLGIAGALFHMLNNAIYKTSLFFCAGNVMKKAGTADMDRIGGLSRIMPFTFGACLIASLAISGLPPLNGFTSKWLIYQGIIQTSSTSKGLWVFWLMAAMFGTALTLASFMKLLHAVFLGQPAATSTSEPGPTRDVSPLMWVPPVLLSLLCVVFGLFATALPLGRMIFPAIPVEVEETGVWEAGPATLLLLAGAAFGFLLYFLAGLGRIRVAAPFVGGEILDQQPGMRVSGVEFYRSVRELRPLAAIYRAAEAKWFDPYDVGRRLLLAGSGKLGELHNGLLPRYLAWCLVGFLVVVLTLLR